MKYDCLLTIATPKYLQEELLDVLSVHPEIVSGFSVLRAEGFGDGAHLRSTLEQVRGRSERQLVQIAMNKTDVASLLSVLHESFVSPEMAYWTIPLNDFGRFS